MEKKYELLQSEHFGLYRIRALRNFCEVREGDMGGLIASEHNLSHDGNCWVAEKALVCGDARVYGNALVGQRAEVFENARVYGRAFVLGTAQVFGYAIINDYATVGGSAQVYGNAVVSNNARVFFSHCTRDISRPENIMMSIKCQTGLEVMNGHVYAYKHVREDLGSLYDPKFKYKVGEYAEVEEYDTNPLNSCSTGLHVSNACYWEGQDQNGRKVIKVRVALDDIISVQAGKIRCKKLFVMGICDSEVF